MRTRVLLAFQIVFEHEAWKTACLPMLAGKGSEAVRKQIADLPNDCLVCDGPRGEKLELVVARSYKYMGVRTYGNGILLPEMASRHSATKPVMARLAYRFFKTTKVPVKKKADVASAMLLSKEVFGSGGHPIFNSGERACLHANVMSIYTLAFGEKFETVEDCLHLTDTEVLHSYEVRAPYATVRFMRLRLSVRMVLKAPAQLLALLAAARPDG